MSAHGDERVYDDYHGGGRARLDEPVDGENDPFVKPSQNAILRIQERLAF